MITRTQYKILITPDDITFDETSKVCFKNKRNSCIGCDEYVKPVKSKVNDCNSLSQHHYNTRSRSKSSKK